MNFSKVWYILSGERRADRLITEALLEYEFYVMGQYKKREILKLKIAGAIRRSRERTQQLAAAFRTLPVSCREAAKSVTEFNLALNKVKEIASLKHH